MSIQNVSKDKRSPSPVKAKQAQNNVVAKINPDRKFQHKKSKSLISPQTPQFKPMEKQQRVPMHAED
jgi:hypothetical protein